MGVRRGGSEGGDERVEVETALEGQKVEKVEKLWAAQPSAGDESLWKL